MKKTYKNQLPKGMEVVETDLRVENGQLVVDVEFKEKFEPKDGDIIYCKDGDSFAIFAYKKVEREGIAGCYCAMQCFADGSKIFNTCGSYCYSYMYSCRYATPEEKVAFLESLEKEYGKRWNAETKQLEFVRWKPKEGESYYFISSSIQVERIYNMSSIVDKERIEANNCFKTAEAAQPYADKMKEMLKNSKAE